MSEHSETIQIFFIVFSILLMLILFLSKGLHDSPTLNRYLSEPAMTLVVGMLFGFLVSMVYVIKDSGTENYYNNLSQDVEQDLADSILGFQTKVFFLALLPPILFNSGYQLQRELFMRHITPISLFACLGTVLSGLVAGGLLIAIQALGLFGNSASFQPSVMELLTFGAMIAATDTVSVVGILQAKQVDPHLFSLVFGESALNDAVSLVLFKTFSIFLVNEAFGDANNVWTEALKFVGHLTVQATCSPLLGMFYCILMALALRKANLRDHPLLELSLYIMPMYIPYMLSEALELSGMIAIFFTGMFGKCLRACPLTNFL
jgi:NhaP-type Na+/H+ or K+/H+ antiporter